MHNANLSGANLTKANLGGAELHETDFSGCWVHGLQLQEAVFKNTEFAGADSSESTSLYNIIERIKHLKIRENKKADLSGVTFSGGITKENLQDLEKMIAEFPKEQRNTDWFQKRMRDPMEKLRHHVDKPVSHTPPSNADIKTGKISPDRNNKIITELIELGKQFYDEAVDDIIQ